MNTRVAFKVLFAVWFASFASTPVPADSLLGPYLGAAVGESFTRSEDDTAFNYYAVRFHQDDVAWKGFVGVRPLPFLGVEFAYVDFGNAHGPPPPSTIFGYFNDNSKQTATTLFGIGYLPLPIPLLDLYAKLGVARLHTDTQVSYLPPTCPANGNCTVPYTVRQNQWTTNFAYGVGAQARFGSVGARAEYERISASSGSPDLLSLGVTWNF